MSTTTYTEIDYEVWMEKYRPIKNKFEDGPRNFETFGEDWEIVKNTDPRYVWTWVDSGDDSAIVSGIAWVNRLVYHITEIPWEENEEIEVTW